MKAQPLKGVRVLEFCWIWAGPLLGQFLADLGAEVIKIESYTRFDPYRSRGVEPLVRSLPVHHWREMSPSFHSLNRNKVSFTADLKDPRALELVFKLVSKSDVVIDNFTSGTMERIGLGVEELRKHNENIVSVSLSGFASGSEWEDMRSYGLIISALSGIEAGIVDDEGSFAGSPTFVLSDPNAALFGLLAVVSGLLARQSGSAPAIEVPQLDAAASLAWGIALSDAVNQDVAQRSSRTMQVSDGSYVVVDGPAELMAADALSAASSANDLDEFIKYVESRGGTAVPMVGLQQAQRSSIFSALPIGVQAAHPVTGEETLVGSPWRHNGQRAILRKPAPTLGEGVTYVLTKILGMSYEEADGLVKEGVVGDSKVERGI